MRKLYRKWLNNLTTIKNSKPYKSGVCGTRFQAKKPLQWSNQLEKHAYDEAYKYNGNFETYDFQEQKLSAKSTFKPPISTADPIKNKTMTHDHINLTIFDRKTTSSSKQLHFLTNKIHKANAKYFPLSLS